MGHPGLLVGVRIRTTAAADPYGMTNKKGRIKAMATAKA
jgi:hypothetical protein